MIIAAARAALARLPTPEFRSVLLKTIGLTFLMLAGLWFGVKELFAAFARPWIAALLPGLPEWVGRPGAVVAGLGLALALAPLVAPVTAIVAGLFLDDIAETVERRDFPNDPPGMATPPVRSLVLALKYSGVIVVGNLAALLLLLIPGINIAAFFLVNGYLIGRESFEFAAMRFRSENEAKLLRRRNAGTVFLAGLIIAAFLSMPILNLATPLFAAAMMVHLHKTISSRDPGFAGGSEDKTPGR